MSLILDLPTALNLYFVTSKLKDSNWQVKELLKGVVYYNVICLNYDLAVS